MKIRHIILSALFIFGTAVTAHAAETVTSPDGNITLTLSADNGQITYDVTSGGQTVMQGSRLGITFENTDFSEGVTLASRQDSEINETYPMISGKAAVYTNHANEAVFTFEKYGDTLDLYARVYNDGVAFRYGYGRDTRALGEATSFHFPHNVTSWMMEYERCYEQFYLPDTLESANGGTYGMPMTVELSGGKYAMITEANLDSSYTGSVLYMDNGTPRVAFEPKQTEPVNIAAPFLSPWRAVVIGDLNTIVTTQMIENLNEPCQISDTSWIKPGISAWTWFNGDPTNDPETYKRYIDFAAEMGWQYVLLDEGWQPLKSNENGRKSYEGTEWWAQEVIDYASERGIGLIVWAPYWDLDTAEKRNRLNEWAAMGIKGVKVDFFDNETQEMLKLYDEITRQTAQLHLLVNYHGCNKPTGERRTWPHLLTREGVYGTEHFMSGEGWGPTAQHNCTLPFTRNAVGPMDYTPAITNYNGKNFFSAGQKAALPIIFESGIQCLSDKPDNYRQSPLYLLFKNFPASWDETRLLSGKIGESVVMLRRKGSDYYIGVTGLGEAEDITVDFLASDRPYHMTIYRDGDSDTDIKVENEIVRNGDIITIPELPNGGAAIKITPLDGSELWDINGHWSQSLVSSLSANGRLNDYFGAEMKPDDKITRGEFVMMLCSAMGIDAPVRTPKFYDSTNTREKNYIAAAVERGIISGISDTDFAPNALITREQAAAIVGRYLQLAGGINLKFPDSADISDYAKMYVSVCADKGIISGYEDGAFRPKNNITRAETAAILSKCE